MGPDSCRFTIRRARPPSRLRGRGALALALLTHVQIASAQGAPAAGGPDALTPPAPQAVAEPGNSEAERKEQARQTFVKGVAALKEGATDAALAEFLRSRALFPTKNATLNAILCLHRLSRLDEELELLEALLRDFANLTVDEKKDAQRKVTELRGVLGTIEIDGAEIDASIAIDGRNRADFPAVAPLRVPAGAHVVRIYKEGFEPFETRIDVAGGQTVRVTAKLRALLGSGRLRVIERANRSLSVIIDDVAVGVTPWEGRLSIGKHVVALRSDDELGTQPAQATVRAQQVTLLTLDAEVLDTSLLVEATPSGAAIAIDSVEVAHGVWDGRLRSGRHRIEVAAGGFVAERLDLSLRSGREVLAVELERDPDAPLWRKPSKIVIEAGVALSVAPTLGGEVAAGCLHQCSGPPGLGAIAAAYGSYELGSGLGFGIGAAYLFAERHLEDRATEVTPLGLTATSGTANDTLRLTGFLFGVAASLRTERAFPVLIRVGAGGLFGRIGDARTATFPTEDGIHESKLTDSHQLNHLYVAPEVRVGLPIVGGHAEVSAGLSALVLIALSSPKWGDSAARSVLLPAKGYSSYRSEALVDPISLILAPGLSARYDF